MGNKVRKVVLFLFLYSAVLWIGFKLGESYQRSTTKIDVEKIKIPAKEDRVYYLVEEHNSGGNSYFTFDKVNDLNVNICFLNNEKLRPLLKLKNVSIYSEEGQKLY